MPERTRERASDVIRIIQLDASAKSDTAGTKRARQGGACNAFWLGVVAASVCVRVCVRCTANEVRFGGRRARKQCAIIPCWLQVCKSRSRCRYRRRYSRGFVAVAVAVAMAVALDAAD